MRAEIVSIGTELLLGTITDTNASYLAQRLAALGIDCHYMSQVGDNLERIVETMRRAWERSDLVVTTGGLGPTHDDLTREAIAALLGEEMIVDAALERHLVSFFTRRGRRMPEANRKQATLIPSATTLSNPVGTAPGWWVGRVRGDGNVGGKQGIVSMPGVPFEMKRMWEREVEPVLRLRSSHVIVSRTLKIMGLGESRVEEVIRDLMDGSNPTLALYAKGDGIHLRLTAKAADKAEVERLIEPLETQVRLRLGDAIYGADDDTPQSVVWSLLDEAGLTFGIIEVGDGAIGSVGPLLGAHTLCLGVMGGSTMEAVRQMLGVASGMVTATGGESLLAQLAEQARNSFSADLALLVAVELEPLGDVGSTVKFSSEVFLVMGSSGHSGNSVSQAWRTTRSEVGRLVGLAAMNYVRYSLIQRARREDQGITA